MTAGSVSGGVAAAARCLALDQHAVTVTRALTAAAVPSMILKGPGLARRLYAAHPGRRRYCDVDVLVSPSDFERAQTVLASLGHVDVAGQFPEDEWLEYERSWLREHPAPLTVDLHRGFAGADDPDALWRLLSGSAETLELSGDRVRVPDAVGCALLVGLHSASPGRGRKAVADLAMALEKFPDPVWAGAAAAATATRSSAPFAFGLRRLPAGVDLAQRLGLNRRTTVAGRMVERLDLVLLTRSAAAIGSVPGLTAKLRYIVRRLVPTKSFMRRASPLAQRGAPGLMLAYVVRPVRLLLPAASRQRRRPSVGFAHTLQRATRLRHWRWESLRAAGWAAVALSGVRRDLARQSLDEIDMPPPPLGGPQTRAAVRAVLKVRRSSCLERSLITQRWLAGQGVEVDLVIGVTAPASGFHAHAWLTSDADASHNYATMHEIHRRLTPTTWMLHRQERRTT